MIVGNGQLAKCFIDFRQNSDVLIFASGVSNSNTKDKLEFEREKKLLLQTLKENTKKTFVYFSSCALSADNYQKNAYYLHKINMEKLIKNYSKNYYIFRLPQLFGDLHEHNTLINFLYKSIKNKQKFDVYDEAYRYVIEINDVKLLVEKYLEYSSNNLTIDLANPYRYKVLDIVYIFEKLLKKKAHYQLIKKEDKYLLDLSKLIEFIKTYTIEVTLGKEYLINNLKNKITREIS